MTNNLNSSQRYANRGSWSASSEYIHSFFFVSQVGMRILLEMFPGSLICIAALGIISVELKGKKETTRMITSPYFTENIHNVSENMCNAIINYCFPNPRIQLDLIGDNSRFFLYAISVLCSVV